MGEFFMDHQIVGIFLAEESMDKIFNAQGVSYPMNLTMFIRRISTADQQYIIALDYDLKNAQRGSKNAFRAADCF